MLQAKILQEKGYRQHEISKKLGVSERTVRNYLKNPLTPRKRKKRASKLDPYLDTVKAVLEDNPYYNNELLYEDIVKAGYQGKISILRDYVRVVRKDILTEAVIRFETIPGHQAQVDWKDLGRQFVNGKMRKLYIFVMTLGFSRKPFIQFATSMKSEVLLQCHVRAFHYFGGVPQTILYDNMKTAFIADENGVFQVQKDLLRFAAHYGFSPERCRVKRPQTKGKVERTIGYILTSLWPRLKAADMSLESLNSEALDWIESMQDKKIGGLSESRRERFEQERAYLKALPDFDLDVRKSIPCAVNRESCIAYETNRYSVNPCFIGKIVELRVDDTARKGEILLCGEHIKSFDLREPGSNDRVIFPEDRAAIMERHRSDRRRIDRIRNKKAVSRSQVEVEIRHPEFYDSMIMMEALI